MPCLRSHRQTWRSLLPALWQTTPGRANAVLHPYSLIPLTSRRHPTGDSLNHPTTHTSSIAPPPMPPSGYAQAPFPSPPTAVPAAPVRSRPSWALWVGGTIALLCIVVLVAAGVMFGPKLLGSEPTPTTLPSPTAAPLPITSPTPTPPPPTPTPTPAATPLPAFDAQVAITASAAQVRVGDALTITVTISNTGQTAFGSLHYQLLGQWEPALQAPTGSTSGHEVDVPSGGSDTTVFILEAVQPGMAQIHANVTVDTRGDSPTTRPISSEYVVEVSVVQ